MELSATSSTHMQSDDDMHDEGPSTGNAAESSAEQIGHAAESSPEQNGPEEGSLASNNQAVASVSPDAEHLKKKIAQLEKELKENLKFWQAAQVNAKAIVITSKRDTLKAQQEQETSALESKTRELGTSRSDLSSLEARKATLQAQLEELSVDLASLRQSIAARKPLLEEAERESKDLQNRYLELSE